MGDSTVKRSVRKPIVTVTGGWRPVDLSYASRLGLRREQVWERDTDCVHCGHRARDHGFGELSPGEQYLMFVPADFRGRLGLGPAPACAWPGCGCERWAPRRGVRDLAETVGLALVKEAWVETPLGPGWIAAYRLVPQRGMPVVAELRIFPAESGRPRQPGRWSGEFLGVAARVPPGGLTTRLLRTVRVGGYRRFAGRVVRETRAKWPEFGADELGPLREPKDQPRRGRPSRPRAFFAEIARDYVRSIEAGSHRPVADVARRRRLASGQVRDALHRARLLGLLERGGRGRYGGALTEGARALLGMRPTRRKPETEGNGRVGPETRYRRLMKRPEGGESE